MPDDQSFINPAFDPDLAPARVPMVSIPLMLFEKMARAYYGAPSVPRPAPFEGPEDSSLPAPRRREDEDIDVTSNESLSAILLGADLGLELGGEAKAHHDRTLKAIAEARARVKETGGVRSNASAH